MKGSDGYQAQRDLDLVVRVVDANELTLDVLDTFLAESAEDDLHSVQGVADAGNLKNYPMFRLRRKEADDDEEGAADRAVSYRLPEPPPWRIAFTKRFDKDIAQLDRKLQGQILETLRKLASFAWPFQPQGDTFKPLGGDLKGMWRYRLGDFRLVVKPVLAESELALMTFAARGSVYD